MLPGTRARREVAAVGSGSRCRALVQAGSCGALGRGCTRQTSSPRDREGARETSWNRGPLESVARPRRRFHAVSPGRSGKLPGTLSPGRVPSLSRAFHPVSGRRGGKQAGALVRTPADPASWPPPPSRSGFAPSQSLQRPPERSIPRPARSAGRPRSRQCAAADRRTLAWSVAGSGTATGKPDGTLGRGSRDLPPGGPLLKGSHPADGSPDGTPFRAWAACTGPGNRPCVPSCFPSGAGETR